MSSDLFHADDTPIRLLDRSLRDKGWAKGVKRGKDLGKDLGVCPRLTSLGGGSTDCGLLLRPRLKGAGPPSPHTSKRHPPG